MMDSIENPTSNPISESRSPKVRFATEDDEAICDHDHNGNEREEKQAIEEETKESPRGKSSPQKPEVKDGPISPRSLHWATSTLATHDVVLHDIEKDDVPVGRGRSTTTAPSVAKELTSSGSSGSNFLSRGRRYTDDSIDGIKNYQDQSKGLNQKLFDFFDSSIPKFQHRLNAYIFLFFIVGLFAIAGNIKDPSTTFKIFFSLLGLELATAIVDHLFFTYVIDKLFAKRFDMSYILRSFSGPTGLLVAVFFAKGSFNALNLDASKRFKFLGDWDTLCDAAIITLLLYSIKNFYARKYYVSLLEKRFTEKLFKMETWRILLSELSSTRPPKTHRTTRSSKTSDVGGRGVQGLFARLPGVKTIHRRVTNAFAELVEATSKYDDRYEDDVDLTSQMRGHGSFNNASVNYLPFRDRRISSNTTIGSNVEEWRSKIRKRKTFWELAARTSSSMGAMKIKTYNGSVIIRRKFQAKEFGRALYMHLSRGNKYFVTHEMLQQIFKGENDYSDNNKEDEQETARSTPAYHPSSRYDNSNNNDDSDKRGGDIEMGNLMTRPRKNTMIKVITGQTGNTTDQETADLLCQSAIDLFDPFKLGYITEEQCMAAVVSAYKEHRLAATSLNDYGELHQSLRSVIDFVFWAAMLVILQSYLALNVYNEYVLPFITMGLTISFALGAGLSNIFLATIFVFFMIPYDIGHKVYIGADPSSRICGFVRNISLLHTTITLLTNEVMKIPNHILYSEKICNLFESGGATFEVLMIFNLENTSHSDQVKIDDYLERVKTYCLEENKADWQSVFLFCSGIDMMKNTIQYNMYVTHRDNYHNIVKPLMARQELLQYMKQLLAEMGLYTLQMKLPVLMNTGFLGMGGIPSTTINNQEVKDLETADDDSEVFPID